MEKSAFPFLNFFTDELSGFLKWLSVQLLSDHLCLMAFISNLNLCWKNDYSPSSVLLLKIVLDN